MLLTEGKRNDVKLADSFLLNPGSLMAIDRGYIDYALFCRWSMAGVFFVTRLKDNAAFEVVEECEIPQTATSAPTNSSASPVLQFGLRKGVSAAGSFPDHSHVGFGADQGRDSFTKQRMVVDYQDTNRFFNVAHLASACPVL